MTAKRLKDSDCIESDCIKPSSKHRQSWFNLQWSENFSFVVYTDGKSMTLSEMERKVRNRNDTWITLPCSSLRRDSILEHVCILMVMLWKLNGKLFKLDCVGALGSYHSKASLDRWAQVQLSQHHQENYHESAISTNRLELSMYRCGCELFLAISDGVHNTFPFLRCKQRKESPLTTFG